MTATLKQRKTYFDVIKVIAIILVIFNHTGGEGYFSFLSANSDVEMSIKVAISAFCRINVMLFFMCSGALLIPKDESIKDTLYKRTLKFTLILIAVSFLWLIFRAFAYGEPIDIGAFVRRIYSKTDFSFSSSYWYLYYYIMFLLILPIVRVICKGKKRQHIKYILGLFLVFNLVIPIMQNALGLSQSVVNITWLTNFIFFYPVMGYYFDSREFEYTKKKGIILGHLAAFSIIYAIIRVVPAVKTGTYYELLMIEMQPFLVIFIFVMCRRIRLKGLTEKIFKEMGACSFGIYLIHGYAFIVLDKLIPKAGYAMSFARTLLVFAISLALIMGLRRLPGLRKVI